MIKITSYWHASSFFLQCFHVLFSESSDYVEEKVVMVIAQLTHIFLHHFQWCLNFQLIFIVFHWLVHTVNWFVAIINLIINIRTFFNNLSRRLLWTCIGLIETFFEIYAFYLVRSKVLSTCNFWWINLVAIF